MTEINPQQADRRDRYATAIRETDGWVLDGGQHMIDAVMAVADAEQAELRRERDLAIAHDRQPYPTAWAYEQACKALRRKEAAIERVLEFAASLDKIGRELAGPEAVHPVAAHIRHLLAVQPDDEQADPDARPGTTDYTLVQRREAHAEGEHCFCGPECAGGVDETGDDHSCAESGCSGEPTVDGAQQSKAREWCKCPSCWGWFVEEHPGEDLDELGRDLGWWSGLPEHRDAPVTGGRALTVEAPSCATGARQAPSEAPNAPRVLPDTPEPS